MPVKSKSVRNWCKRSTWTRNEEQRVPVEEQHAVTMKNNTHRRLPVMIGFNLTSTFSAVNLRFKWKYSSSFFLLFFCCCLNLRAPLSSLCITALVPKEISVLLENDFLAVRRFAHVTYFLVIHLYIIFMPVFFYTLGFSWIPVICHRFW